MIACSALPQTEYDFPVAVETQLPAPQAPAKLPTMLPPAGPVRQDPPRWSYAVPPYSLRLGMCAGSVHAGPSSRRAAGAAPVGTRAPGTQAFDARALGAAAPKAAAVQAGIIPLYLDLQNPRTGSILVTGDDGCGKTRLMQSMVAWALRDHSHRELQAAVIASRERSWNACMRRYAPARPFRAVPDGGWPAERVCLELASLVEQRLEGDPTGPVILLVIDGLAPMLGSSHNVQAALRFLIDQGPLVRVRPIISLSTHQALNLHYWVSLFRTSLIGQISSPAEAHPLTAEFPLDALPGCPGQFVAVGPVGTHPRWTRFWMVGPEEIIPDAQAG